MKQNIIYFLMLLLSSAVSAQVGINNPTPHASAALDVTSTTQGFLPPRMTLGQRDAIDTPAAGLTIFNRTSNCLETWVGQQWFGPCNSQIDRYPGGTIFCNGIVTKIIPVVNAFTGKTWMDRNLGASQVATSSINVKSYGDLYQWGRRADGHQCRISPTTSTLSSVDQPAHGDFILAPSAPYDWRSPQNDNLWQVNNPCPSGYRLPTETELNNERLSWVQPPINSTNDAAGAFASPLKLPMAGLRSISNGLIYAGGNDSYYWSSTVSGTYAHSIYFNSFNASISAGFRAVGLSVRCLKD
jgi:uncharacterized protein (TIGR02145 family)